MKSFLPLLLMLGACSSIVRQPYDVNMEYLRSIDLRITPTLKNGDRLAEIKFTGVGVVPPAASYEVRGNLKSDADFLVWQTCHAQKRREKEGDSFNFTWKPNEESKRCQVLEVRSTEKDKNRNQGAYMLIDDPVTYKLRGPKIYCNEEILGDTGVNACHTKQNLNVSIRWEQDFFVVPNKVCGFPADIEKTNQKLWRFQMPSKPCAVTINAAGERKSMLLLLFPYRDITVTGEGD